MVLLFLGGFAYVYAMTALLSGYVDQYISGAMASAYSVLMTVAFSGCVFTTLMLATTI
jgi:hypothetical protein